MDDGPYRPPVVDDPAASPGAVPAPRRGRLHYGLTLVGIPGYLYCFPAHVCMAGHMHHPPYGPGAYLIDASWVIAFLAAAFFAFRHGATWPRRIGVAVLLGLLVVSRLVLESLGGATLLFEAPAILGLGIWATLGLGRTRRKKT